MRALIKNIFIILLVMLAAGAALLLAGGGIPLHAGRMEKPPTIEAPPGGCLYHGAYISGPSPKDDTAAPSDLASYEAAVGKAAAWVYCSNHWFQSRAFPASAASWIRDTGSMPFIRLMLWSAEQENTGDPAFTLDAILKGVFDDDLRRWARSARDFGTPLIAEFGPEANGSWYPWSGWWNGAGEKTAYGSAALPDGPERFRDAYRHIIDLMRQENAFNITWVFHVNYNDFPPEPWNRFENYYPGDTYIDWLGVSVYGAQKPSGSQWPEFSELMNAVYPRLAALSSSKPVIVAELGVARDSPLGSQASWAQQALTCLAGNRWPRVIGFSWWNKTWQNDANQHNNSCMRVQDNPALAAVFQKLIGGNPAVLGKAVFSSEVSGVTKKKSAPAFPGMQDNLSALPGAVAPDRIVTEYYEPDVIKSRFTYKHGLKNGLCREYSAGGRLMSEAHYSDGRLNGERREFYESGNLKSRCAFRDGTAEGACSTYYESGRMESENRYESGRRTGQCKTFHESGTLKSDCSYRDDKREGPCLLYYPDGKLMTRQSCSRDTPDGPAEEYYPGGNLKLTATYRQGIWDGPCKTFYESGNLMSRYCYAGGVQEGDFTAYYESGNLRSRFTYRSGKQDGPGEEYYESGRLKTRGVFRAGAQEGIFYTYYEDGTVKRMQTFANGRLLESKSFDERGNLEPDQNF